MSRWGWAGLLCALIIGVVGMHALAMSCTGPSHATMAASAGTTTHHDGPGLQSHDIAATAVAAGAGEHGGTSTGVMSVCMALLTSAAGLLAALMLRRPSGGWTLHRSAAQGVLRCVQRLRAPPDLVALSILRC